MNASIKEDERLRLEQRNFEWMKADLTSLPIEKHYRGSRAVSAGVAAIGLFSLLVASSLFDIAAPEYRAYPQWIQLLLAAAFAALGLWLLSLAVTQRRYYEHLLLNHTGASYKKKGHYFFTDEDWKESWANYQGVRPHRLIVKGRHRNSAYWAAVLVHKADWRRNLATVVLEQQIHASTLPDEISAFAQAFSALIKLPVLPATQDHEARLGIYEFPSLTLMWRQVMRRYREPGTRLVKHGGRNDRGSAY